MNFNSDPTNMMQNLFDFWGQQYSRFNQATQGTSSQNSTNDKQQDLHNMFLQWQSMMANGFNNMQNMNRMVNQNSPFTDYMKSFYNPFTTTNKDSRVELLEKHLEAVEAYRKLVVDALDVLKADQQNSEKTDDNSKQ